MMDPRSRHHPDNSTRRGRLLSLITRAAALGEPCPTNADLAAAIGAASISTPAEIIKRLEGEGVLAVIRHNMSRQIIIVATGERTAPPNDTAAMWRARRENKTVVRLEPVRHEKAHQAVADDLAPQGAPAPRADRSGGASRSPVARDQAAVRRDGLDRSPARLDRADEGAQRAEVEQLPRPVDVGLARDDRGCRWPMWGDKEPISFKFCCAAKAGPLPYCAEHTKKAYTPAQPLRSRAVRA